jgi:type IV fimbrial biogenesis protein FimT
MPADSTLRRYGFTLVELLVVVALVAVLAALAVPSFAGMFQRHRVDAVRHELLASLQLARVEAIRLGAAVVLERQSDCATVLESGQHWGCGWQMYADLNGNNSRDTATEPILQSSSLPPHTSLHKSANAPLTRVWADRFGQIQPLALHFVIRPVQGDSANGGILCMGAGARFRWIQGAASCG